MSQQLLPIVGAVVGAFYGGPSGAQLGWAAGAAIGGVVASTESKPGPRLGELPAQSFDEGTPRAIVYGTSQTSGYVIAAAPAMKTNEYVDGGGKGGGSVETEVAYRSYAIAMCEGPIAAVLRVWADDKLVYDVRPESLIREESERWISNKNIFLGDEDQLPSTFLQLNVSGLDTPAYRGTAYMVFGLEDLSERRGTIPMYRFEVCKAVDTEVSPIVVGPVSSTQGACLSLDSAGRPTLLTSGWAIGKDAAYEITTYDAAFNFESALGIVNAGDTVYGDLRLWPTFISEGFAVSVDGNYGTLRSLINGKVHAYYKPTLAASPSWYYAEVGSRQATNIFLRNNVLYVGVGVSGSTSTAWNRVMAFNATISNASSPNAHDSDAILPIESITSVSTDNVFWMHVSRQGAVRTINSSGDFKRYDAGLIFEDDETLPSGLPATPFTYSTLCGFGVDEDHDVIAFIVKAIGIAYLRLYEYSTLTLIYEAALESTTDNANLTRVLFSDDAVYVQHTRRIYRIGLGSSAGQPTRLDLIVSDLCDRVGLTVGDYDVTDLNDSVTGLSLAGDYTAASAIDVLRSCYFFDKTEPGDKLYFPKRGKPVALTLGIDDLVEAPDMSRREQASEVPKKLHLHYANATAGYAPIKTTYMRSSQDIQSNLETSLQVPVVLDTDSAAQMVDKMFKVTTADAQGEIKLSIPSSFIRLVASDCIGLNLRGQVRRLRIDDIEMADGVMHLTCRADRQSAYTSILTGIPVDPPVMPPSTISGGTVYAVLDIPARVDSEDDLNYLVAGTGASEGWAGWSYQRSLDGGANFSTVRSITANAVVGRLLGPISAASEHYTDAANVVRVQLVNVNQVIEGQTVQAFLSESGAFALEGASGWEILQYLDADDEGGGVYALSVLHRGLLNTPPNAHAVGALFVLLDRASHIPAQAAWIGQDLTHRGVSIGNTAEGAAITTETFTGQSQIEWPVAYLTLGRDGSDVITGAWIPRHRFGADVNPVASINFQGFRVTLDDGVDAVSFDVTAPSFTYDSSAMSAPVDVSVAPINRITGPGPAVTESI